MGMFSWNILAFCTAWVFTHFPVIGKVFRYCKECLFFNPLLKRQFNDKWTSMMKYLLFNDSTS
jgi:hypothetical protein